MSVILAPIVDGQVTNIPGFDRPSIIYVKKNEARFLWLR